MQYILFWILSMVLTRAYLVGVFKKPLDEGAKEAVNYVTVLAGLVFFSLYTILWFYFDFAPNHDWSD